jgi:hypothetical protein
VNLDTETDQGSVIKDCPGAAKEKKKRWILIKGVISQCPAQMNPQNL